MKTTPCKLQFLFLTALLACGAKKDDNTAAAAAAADAATAAPSRLPAPAQPAAPQAPEDVAAPPAAAERTASGLASLLLRAGTGTKHPAADDIVRVHYSGWTTDGKLFDSSGARGEPATFALNGVIAGWTQGLQLMRVGEKRRLWVPETLAYRGAPGAPAGMLVFDVELLDILAKPETPADVAAVPAGAQCSESGLCSRVLQKGNSKEHPAATSRVRVHYTGWTTDGTMFDSSLLRGGPASLQLDAVIPGWSEGVQLMVVGEKRRLWIPESLAFQGRSGAPPGLLVFDVELLAIEP